MTYTIEEIKKFLDLMPYLPIIEIGAKPIRVNYHQIISELVEELEKHRDLVFAVKEDIALNELDKRFKLFEAAQCALEHLESSGRRPDIQKMLKEALGG